MAPMAGTISSLKDQISRRVSIWPKFQAAERLPSSSKPQKPFNTLTRPSERDAVPLSTVQKVAEVVDEPRSRPQSHQAALLPSPAGSYPVDLVHAYAAPSPLPVTTDFSAPEAPPSPSIKSRRPVPPPLDLDGANDKFTPKSEATVDKAEKVGSLKSSHSTSKSEVSKFSEGPSDAGVSGLETVLLSPEHKQASHSQDTSIIGILRDAGRRSSLWMSNTANPTGAAQGVRIVEPAVPNRYRQVQGAGRAGVPQGLPWLSKEEASAGDGQDEPVYKPWWTLSRKLIALVLTFVVFGAIAAGIVVSNKKKSNPEATGPQTKVDNPVTLEECLTLYHRAPTDEPSTYNCNTCVPLLKQAGNSFVNATTESGTGEVLQFCALMDMYTSAANQKCFSDGAWGLGVDPCNGRWQGVECIDGRINSLTLQDPCTPAKLPDSLGDLVTLSKLRIVGTMSTGGVDSSAGPPTAAIQIPFGPVPKSIINLPLTSLAIEGTSLTDINNINFEGLIKLNTLILIGNLGLGRQLKSLNAANLQELTIVNQGLTATSWISPGDSRRVDRMPLLDTFLPYNLTYLNLSYNNFTGAIPTFGRQQNLKQLILENNDFSSFSYIPASVSQVSFAGNPKLTGIMENVCLSTITKCDLRKTALRRPEGHACDACQF